MCRVQISVMGLVVVSSGVCAPSEEIKVLYKAPGQVSRSTLGAWRVLYPIVIACMVRLWRKYGVVVVCRGGGNQGLVNWVGKCGVPGVFYMEEVREGELWKMKECSNF